MSKTTDYMDEVKRRKGLTSNYQLSKLLEISEPAISECYSGKKHADLYIGTRLALALGMEPIHLLAEVRAEAEKNEKKRNFWLGFLTHAAVAFVCLVGPVLGLGWPSEANASTASTIERSAGLNLNTNYARLSSALRRAVASLFATWKTGALAPT